MSVVDSTERAVPPTDLAADGAIKPIEEFDEPPRIGADVVWGATKLPEMALD